MCAVLRCSSFLNNVCGACVYTVLTAIARPPYRTRTLALAQVIVYSNTAGVTADIDVYGMGWYVIIRSCGRVACMMLGGT